jgi:rhodanese-related sulfurtransferase
MGNSGGFKNPISYRLIINLVIVGAISVLAVHLIYKGLYDTKKLDQATPPSGTAVTAPNSRAPETDLLDPLELKALLAARRDQLRIVDLRSRARFHKEHLASAINIPGDELEVRAADELSQSDRIVLVDCACDGTKQASFIRRTALINSGFKQVDVLAGEIEDWRRSGLEVVTTP